jgi:hypothetical protein
MRLAGAALLLAASCAAPPPRFAPELRLSWEKNMLAVHSPEIPGGRMDTWYLEAFCRSASTNRDWKLTTIPHSTEKLADSTDRRILLRSRVEGGVEVDHEITVAPGEVRFEVVAVNKGPRYVDAVWVQPCTRVGAFCGGDKQTYIPKSFIFVGGKRTFLDQARRTEEAVYKGGQVYVPADIDRKDVNPRPLSPDVPSNGLIGCVSADGRLLFATAWEPYQELFQGVIICLHSDFRLGGLNPGETKRARGRMYFMENDPDALVARWRRDFGR